jgi:hypothetical protein
MKAQRLVPHRGIEVKPAESDQGAEPHRLRSGGILVLAVLAVIYTDLRKFLDMSVRSI